MSLLLFLGVGVGSALGGMVRHWVSGRIARNMGEFFPWGTLLVNISGAFLIGLFFGRRSGLPLHMVNEELWQLFLVSGFLGGYTTFSSFSLQTVHLLRGGSCWQAFLNSAATLLGCLAGVAAGFGAGSLL